MSLIKASYTVHRAKSYAGMIADTSLYNIDGTCVADIDTPIARLLAVKDVQPIEGHKVVVVAKDASLPIIGVGIMSHAYSPAGVYEAGIAVNVMTHGRVWVPVVKAGFAVEDAAFDKLVSFNADGVVAKGGAVKTSYKFTGEYHKSDDPTYDLVKIQVLQSVSAPAP